MIRTSVVLELVQPEENIHEVVVVEKFITVSLKSSLPFGINWDQLAGSYESHGL